MSALDLLRICIEFRRLIEIYVANTQRSVQRQGYFWLSDFPEGCCSSACEILSMYLHETHFIKQTSISMTQNGKRSDGRTHAWLYVDNTLVDVTADQFGEGKEKVIVVETGTVWHDEFTGYERRPYITIIQSLEQSIGTKSHRQTLNFLKSMKKREKGKGIFNFENERRTY